MTPPNTRLKLAAPVPHAFADERTDGVLEFRL